MQIQMLQKSLLFRNSGVWKASCKATGECVQSSLSARRLSEQVQGADTLTWALGGVGVAEGLDFSPGPRSSAAPANALTALVC